MRSSLILAVSHLLIWFVCAQKCQNGYDNAFFCNATLIELLSVRMFELGNISHTWELLNCQLKYLPS